MRQGAGTDQCCDRPIHSTQQYTVAERDLPWRAAGSHVLAMAPALRTCHTATTKLASHSLAPAYSVLSAESGRTAPGLT